MKYTFWTEDGQRVSCWEVYFTYDLESRRQAEDLAVVFDSIAETQADDMLAVLREEFKGEPETIERIEEALENFAWRVSTIVEEETYAMLHLYPDRSKGWEIEED